MLGPSAITTHSWLGRRTPLHATSSGKVLLAHLPEPERERRLAAPWSATRRTPSPTPAPFGRS
ncbi:IclR family transcriptional regulator domain-containing protein [Streptomyces sp. NPDC002078]